ERSENADGEFGADPDDRRQQCRWVVVEVELTRFVLAGEVEHDELVRGPGVDPVADAVAFDDTRIEEIARQPEHHPVSAPVGDIQVRIVDMLHEPSGGTFEVAPVILVDEAAGRDPCPGRQQPNRSPLAIVEWPVDRQKFVVLILAHYPSTPSERANGFARKDESSPRWKNR